MPDCTTCDNLDLEDPGFGFRRKDIEFDDLAASVGKGCSGCQVIYDGLLARRGTIADISSVGLISFGDKQPLAVTAFKNGTCEVFQFYTLPDEPSPWPLIRAGRHISVDSSSEECLELASTWINDCWWNHSCGQKYGPLPTRVLQLNVNDDSVFLVEPEGRTKERFAALSHCWGAVMPLKTEKANIAKHKTTGIPLSSLPKTFQDAVVICRRLKIDYIWIDSLCIIQDSTEDWEEEAGKMAQIYAAADFTIAAHSASDSSGGCFVPRSQTGPHASTRVEYKTPNGATGALYVRNEPPGSPNGDHLSTNLPYFRDPGPSKLSTRGWVFQERLLSRRTLHFTAHELVFECAKGFQCECTLEPVSVATDLVKYKQQYTVPRKPAALDSSSFAADDPDAWLAHRLQRIMNIKDRKPATDLNWCKVVEGFTRLDLTYTSDRLPALYGLAESKRRATSTASFSDEYLFGLWKSELLTGLLWQVGRAGHFSFDACQSKRQPDAFAPSWSWASVTGPVHYDNDLLVMDRSDPKKLQPYGHRFKVLDVKTTPSTSNALGPGTGSISFLCGVIPVRIFLASPQGELSGKSFIAASKKAVPGKTECPYGFFNPDVRDDGTYEVGQESEGDDSEYVFMVVAHIGHQSIYGGGKPVGLVLKKSGSSSYKRVGLMRECMYVLKDWEDVSEASIITLV